MRVDGWTILGTTDHGVDGKQWPDITRRSKNRRQYRDGLWQGSGRV